MPVVLSTAASSSSSSPAGRVASVSKMPPHALHTAWKCSWVLMSNLSGLY
jgi:hypothetical protein